MPKLIEKLPIYLKAGCDSEVAIHWFTPEDATAKLVVNKKAL